MSDTDNPLATIFAELKLHIGKLGNHFEDVKKLQKQAYIAEHPITRSESRAIVIPSNGFGVIDFQGPTSGHFWYVRSISLSGTTPIAVVAGRADVFITAGDYTGPAYAAGYSTGIEIGRASCRERV